MRTAPPSISPEAAEDIAVRAFSFVAEEEDRMSRFFALTGFDPEDIATVARAPSFLPGVLDYLLADETLLLTYCASVNLEPSWVAAAQHALTRRLQRGAAGSEPPEDGTP